MMQKMSCRLVTCYCRCLVGDPSGKSFGDVAFMEHHNLETNIKRTVGCMCIICIFSNTCVSHYYCTIYCTVWLAGLNSSGWAAGWVTWDFELLCSDGNRTLLTEWKACNLGAVPPNIVMTRPVLTTRIYDLLMKSQVCTLIYCNHWIVIYPKVLFKPV